MKKLLILFVSLLISISSFAQAIAVGINYKAVIKDGSGNLVTGQTIDVRFTIYDNDTPPYNEYQESHTTTTDDNGIIVLTIGEGTYISGTFYGIEWGAALFSLQVEIDIEQDGSYVTFDPEPFKKVPYASYSHAAYIAEVAQNVTGLEKINGPSGGGWRLVGSDPDNFGQIGNGAIDLSLSSIESDEYGATGISSIAIGHSNKSNGNSSVAIGYANTASKDSSVAIGDNSNATGAHAKAFGQMVNAPSYSETVMGKHNTYYSVMNATNWDPADRLFVLGNGTDTSNRSDALIVLKNGTVTAPSLDMAEITDDKALTTKEYVDENGSSGLEYLVDNAVPGYRLKNENAFFHANLGFNAVDLSIVDFSTTEIGAKGTKSFASGSNTKAIGSYAVAMGNFTTANGNESFAIGSNTVASANNSTAMGNNTLAIGLNSTAIGQNTIATANSATAIGKNNVSEIDGLFVVGNGTSSDIADRNNALVIHEDGNATFDGEIQHSATGTANMIPIAYGSVNALATPGIVGGTGNFTVTRNAITNEYTISVTGKSCDLTNTVTSVVANTSNFRSVNVTYSGGNISVHIFTSSFVKVASPFQFTVYQQ